MYILQSYFEGMMPDTHQVVTNLLAIEEAKNSCFKNTLGNISLLNTDFVESLCQIYAKSLTLI